MSSAMKIINLILRNIPLILFSLMGISLSNDSALIFMLLCLSGPLSIILLFFSSKDKKSDFLHYFFQAGFIFCCGCFIATLYGENPRLLEKVIYWGFPPYYITKQYRFIMTFNFISIVTLIATVIYYFLTRVSSSTKKDDVISVS